MQHIPTIVEGESSTFLRCDNFHLIMQLLNAFGSRIPKNLQRYIFYAKRTRESVVWSFSWPLLRFMHWMVNHRIKLLSGYHPQIIFDEK